MIIAVILVLLLAVFIIASLWTVFTKAGEPGWAALVPIYNYMVIARIGGKPEWWGLLCLVPFVGIIFAIILMIELAKAFGKSAVYGLGLAFLGFIFFPMLAFGDARHMGSGGGGRSKRAVSRFDDDDDDDRPRRPASRSRADDDDDDRPRRPASRSRDDDDDDDRPRGRSSRRDDDDDDDDDRPRKRR